MPLHAFGAQRRNADPAHAARRRCGARLVEVERVAFDPHRLIDVVSIDDLVRVADRLRLPVLHYRERHLDVYVVPDSGVSYRLRVSWRPDAGSRIPFSASPAAAPTRAAV